MAKGDAIGAAGQMGQAMGQGQNTKMDQYSVMHHLMQQLGQAGNSIAPSNNTIGQGIGAGYGGGGRMGGQMGQPSYGGMGQALGQAMGQVQPEQQMANNYGTSQEVARYQPQQNMQRQLFNRSGIGPMMNNMGLQGSIAPQNRFRQQLNQQPPTEAATNQQQV